MNASIISVVLLLGAMCNLDVACAQNGEIAAFHQ